MSWSSSRSWSGMGARHRVVGDLGHRRVLDQQGRRVDADAGGAAVEPEAEDRLVLGADVGVVPVEVRLLGREQVEVPLARACRRGPSCGSRSGRRGTRTASRSAARRPSGPRPGRNQNRSRSGEPGPAASAAWNQACRSETWFGTMSMIVRMPSVEGLGDERLGLRRACRRPDRSPGSRRRRSRRRRAGETYHGREPDGIDAEVAQVGESRADAGEVAGAVAVAVGEAADVDLVDDRAAPPGGIVGRVGGRSAEDRRRRRRPTWVTADRFEPGRSVGPTAAARHVAACGNVAHPTEQCKNSTKDCRTD